MIKLSDMYILLHRGNETSRSRLNIVTHAESDGNDERHAIIEVKSDAYFQFTKW